MQADPAADADTDATDLCARDEDADLTGMTLPRNAEAGKGRDQPVFEGGDEGPDVAAPPGKVEHHIGHALARAVIGEAPAAAAFEDREPAWREQLGLVRAGARGIDGRGLEQPHASLRPPPPNGRN